MSIRFGYINRPLVFVLSFFSSSCMCPTLFHNLITVRETLSVIREDKSPGTKKNKISKAKGGEGRKKWRFKALVSCAFSFPCNLVGLFLPSSSSPLKSEERRKITYQFGNTSVVMLMIIASVAKSKVSYGKGGGDCCCCCCCLCCSYRFIQFFFVLLFVSLSISLKHNKKKK